MLLGGAPGQSDDGVAVEHAPACDPDPTTELDEGSVRRTHGFARRGVLAQPGPRVGPDPPDPSGRRREGADQGVGIVVTEARRDRVLLLEREDVGMTPGGPVERDPD